MCYGCAMDVLWSVGMGGGRPRFDWLEWRGGGVAERLVWWASDWALWLAGWLAGEPSGDTFQRQRANAIWPESGSKSGDISHRFHTFQTACCKTQLHNTPGSLSHTRGLIRHKTKLHNTPGSLSHIRGVISHVAQNLWATLLHGNLETKTGQN